VRQKSKCNNPESHIRQSMLTVSKCHVATLKAHGNWLLEYTLILALGLSQRSHQSVQLGHLLASTHRYRPHIVNMSIFAYFVLQCSLELLVVASLLTSSSSEHACVVHICSLSSLLFPFVSLLYSTLVVLHSL
jgi:hypothetical protein